MCVLPLLKNENDTLWYTYLSVLASQKLQGKYNV